MRQGHIGVYDEGDDAGTERRRVGGRGSRCEYSRTMLKAIHATSHVFGAGYTTQQALIPGEGSDLTAKQLEGNERGEGESERLAQR
jgi:hypothetical protein